MVAESRNSGEIWHALLKPSKSGFSHTWLRKYAEDAVPLATPGFTTRLASSIASGAGACGHNELILLSISAKLEDTPARRIAADIEDILTAFPAGENGFIATLPDLSGALLVTTQNYSIVAGPNAFVQPVVGSNIVEAKRQFALEAINSETKNPQLIAIAAEYGCSGNRDFTPAWRAWRTPSDVSIGSPIHQQLQAMRDLAARRISPKEFDEMWWDLRSQAIAAGDEPAGHLGLVLRQVSSAAEDYVADPELRDPEDLDDAALISAVAEALAKLESSGPDA